MEAIAANRYVRIDPRFQLRGWLGQPYAIVDHLTATAHFVPKGVFSTLRLCNGRFRASLSFRKRGVPYPTGLEPYPAILPSEYDCTRAPQAAARWRNHARRRLCLLPRPQRLWAI